MNTPEETTRSAKTDEFSDRLIDRGLTEILGNETPPDMSGRMLAAAGASMPQPAAQTQFMRPGARRWLVAAVAASLLVGGTFLLWPSVMTVRESAKKDSAKASRLGQNPNKLVSRALPQSNAESAAMNGAPISGERQYVVTDAYDKLAAQPSTLGDTVSALPPGFKKAANLPAPSDGVYFEAGLEQQVALGLEGRYSGGRGLDQQYVHVLAEGERLADVASARRGGYGRGLVKETVEGTGPGLSGDQYTRIVENPFIKAEGAQAVSTFSIDVDTASYANVRQFLLGTNTLPPPDAVRIEELINYFDYDYAGPTPEEDAPFAAHVEVAGCPWKPEHRLVRIGIKGREMDRQKRPKSNLVFLVDVSGSMDEPNKLPLVVYGLQQLTRELGENDRVAIVVYASSEGLVLPSTPGSDQQAILTALGQLQAGGSTAGGAGIQLAYQIAEDNLVDGGTNRVVLCTDGDFNVGVTSTAELERLCEQKAKETGVFLSVLGFGRGNLNDAMMEAIADHGNGNYHYVDNRTEARRVLVEEMTGTLVTIAKDVKIQVEFNPRQVAGYRLVGYENRLLRTEDFNDDTKDAGEIGAGHTVTALYEIVPAGQQVDVPPVDDLKYQAAAADDSATDDPASAQNTVADITDELLTLKMRYKQPDGDTSRKLDWAVTDEGKTFRAASGDFQFAAAVAGFGLLLRDSQHKGNLTLAAVVELAQSGIGQDEHGHRAEFLEIVRRAQALRGE